MLGSTEIPPVDINPMGMRRLIATRFLVLPRGKGTDNIRVEMHSKDRLSTLAWR